MRTGTARHQMTLEQRELPLAARGEALARERRGEAGPTPHGPAHPGNPGNDDLMAMIVERRHLARALKRVRRNQGSPGIDGMTVDELAPYLRDHWVGIREALLAGTYQPSAVRRHETPKPDGRVRTFGIPTVLDRFIQQAVLGWTAYFRLAETPGVFVTVEKWMPRRLRLLVLRQWRQGRTIYRELHRRGVQTDVVCGRAARFGRSWWHVAAHHALHIALPGSYFESLGIPRLIAR